MTQCLLFAPLAVGVNDLVLFALKEAKSPATGAFFYSSLRRFLVGSVAFAIFFFTLLSTSPLIIALIVGVLTLFSLFVIVNVLLQTFTMLGSDVGSGNCVRGKFFLDLNTVVAEEVGS